MRLAFAGSSPAAADRDGAGTHLRGIVSALRALGHEVTCLEPAEAGHAEDFDVVLEDVAVLHALDPEVHHPVPPRDDLRVDLALLADRRPHSEARVEELFFRVVEALPQRTFLLAGSGWDDRVRGLPNLRHLGRVPPGDHNVLHCSALAVLGVTRTGALEAAGAGACVIADAGEGIEELLRPCKEVKLARDGRDVAEWVADLDPDEARRTGEAARERVLAEHTYAHRARRLESILAHAATRRSA